MTVSSAALFSSSGKSPLTPSNHPSGDLVRLPSSGMTKWCSGNAMSPIYGQPGKFNIQHSCDGWQTCPEVGGAVKFRGSLRPDMGCPVLHDSPAERTWRGLRSPKNFFTSRHQLVDLFSVILGCLKFLWGKVTIFVWPKRMNSIFLCDIFLLVN